MEAQRSSPSSPTTTLSISASTSPSGHLAVVSLPDLRDHPGARFSPPSRCPCPAVTAPCRQRLERCALPCFPRPAPAVPCSGSAKTAYPEGAMRRRADGATGPHSGGVWHRAKCIAQGKLDGNNCCDGGVQHQQVGAEMRKAGGKGKIAMRGNARSQDHYF